MNQLVLSLVLMLPAAEGDMVSAEKLRETVQKSVPFLESRGQEWIDQKKCVSCHQVPFMVWSLREAKEHGLKLDEVKLQATTDWALDMKHWAAQVDENKFDEQAMAEKNIDVIYQLLFAADYSAQGEKPAWATSYQAHLLKWQESNGSWKACGQLPGQKRPAEETAEVTTMWALLALSPEKSSDDALKDTIQRTREFIAKAAPGKSSEWWAMRLLFERRFGEQAKADEYLSHLLKRQRDDGGWGWLVEDESDALGTGTVLYALSAERAANVTSAIQRAHAFLVKTQQADGSWNVKGTQQRHKDAVKPTSIYWGTAWAAIGILRTLPGQSP